MSTDSQPVRRAQTRRSGTGLLIVVILLPLLIGVLACIPPLPVPLGDPESSAINPALSGAWVFSGDSGDGQCDGVQVMILDPYDKRSWLLSLISLEPVEAAPPVADTSTETELAPVPAASLEQQVARETEALPETLPEAVNTETANTEIAKTEAAKTEAAKTESGLSLSATHRLCPGPLKATAFSFWKSWLTEIEGETFITWEPKTPSVTLPSMLADEWWALRLRREGADIIHLDLFLNEDDSWDEVKTPQELEDIIRRNMKTPGFFLNENEENEFTMEFHRMAESDLEKLATMLEEFGILDNFL